MKWIDFSFPDPALNLACDEALLDEADEGTGGEVLRFWESPVYFVVVGFANSLSAEVDLDACRRLGIPILRRCSGGGAVLQGPGCLNYALVLELQGRTELATIPKANHFIMNRQREVLSALLGREVTVKGTTDLALEDRKISGNAQRRKRRALMFHGTILRELDLERAACALREPSRMPTYRSGREHRDFMLNVAIDRAALVDGLRRAWGAQDGLAEFARSRVERLAQERYDRPEWTTKFE